METTMSTETKQFLRKTKELSKLVSAMKELEISCEQELHEIEKKLTDLSTAVKKDKCLNAGGKFEWVDSVLVKVSSSFLFYFSLFTHCFTMIFRHQSTENCVRFIFAFSFFVSFILYFNNAHRIIILRVSIGLVTK